MKQRTWQRSVIGIEISSFKRDAVKKSLEQDGEEGKHGKKKGV